MLKYKYIGSLILLSIIFSFSSKADNQIIQAMRDELNRSMSKLKMDELKKPYYIEYKVTIRYSHTLSSALGALTDSANIKSAHLTVGVRVGDYKFDNTNFFDFGLSFFGSGDEEESFKNRLIPLNPDYNSLLREIWLATDAAYKQVSEIYAKKEATLKNRILKDTIQDFLELSPDKHFDTIPMMSFDEPKFETLTNKISSVFLKYPDINISTAGIEYIPETVYYVNSEGREYIKNDCYIGLEIVASTQSDDGMPLANFYSAYAILPNELPSDDSLIKATNSMAEKLVSLKKADILDEPYSGPILFDGQAAAEMFAQVFAPNLVTQREPLTEQGIQENDRYAAFQTKVGGRVLPEFLSVNAMPSLMSFSNVSLLGYHIFDDDGVVSQDINLINNGYLKNLLSSRVPTKRIHTDNGHEFGGAAMLSTLEIITGKDHQENQKDLVAKMMKLCKDRELPYGIIVRKVMNQNIMFTTLFRITSGDFPITQLREKVPLIEVYKVYPDGKEVLVRGCEAKGFTPQSFKDILMTGNNLYVMNYLSPAVSSPFVSGGRQYIGATVIVPDLLFEDGEIRPVEQDFPKPPILSNPIGEK